MAIDKLTRTQGAPAPAPTPAEKAKQTKTELAATRSVDVALFRKLPGSGSPMVSAVADETLGKLDPAAMALSSLETKSPLAAKAVGGVRFATRVAGPSLWSASVVLNAKLLLDAIKDPTISAGSKIALATGTAANAVGAGAAIVSALPGKLAGRLGVGTVGQLTANKIAGIFGGISGIIFNTINMVETLRDPEAKPAARFFAKTGFVLGALGFVAGTVALTASLPLMAPVMAAAPGLLPIATTVATASGIAGFAVLIGQLFLGKNRWVSDRVKGTFLG